jgi:hypothetical protein
MRTGREPRETVFSWRLISESLRNPDVLMQLACFAVILLAVSLALLFPLPDDIATVLAHFD